tara:strand:+ start:5082 stop:5927 length:846 start_codon:yes stop_codon:yes gene_type:complete
MGFFLPLVGYGAAALGGTTAATGLTSSAVSAFEPISEAFGQTERQQAENEVFDRTADPGRRINRGFGEKFFDFFTGRDQGRMEQLALEKSNRKINRDITNAGYDLNKITSALKTLKLDPSLTPKLDDNQSKRSYELELDRARNAIQVAQSAQALYPGIDVTGKDVSGINLAVSQAQRAEKDAETRKSDDRYKTEVDYRDTTRQDNLRARQEERADLLARQIRQDKNAELNRQQQFQIQQMQYGLENRRLDMQESRNFRNDRMKAIAQIMQGMQAASNAFAY